MWIPRLIVLLGCLLLMSGCARGYIFTFGNMTDTMVEFDPIEFPEATVRGTKVWSAQGTATAGTYYVTMPETLNIGWTREQEHFSREVPLDELGRAFHLVFVVTEGDQLAVFFLHDQLQPNVTKLVKQRYGDD